MKNERIPKPRKKTTHKKNSSKYLIFFAVFILLALCLGAFLGARLVFLSLRREASLGTYDASSPIPSVSQAVHFPDEEDLSDSFAVSIHQPTIVGTQHAVICAELKSEKNPSGSYGFLLRDILHNTGFEIDAQTNGNFIYARANRLMADTDYLITAFVVEEDRKLYARDMVTFATPKRILTLSQVDEILKKEFPDGTANLSDEKRMAYETDACLSLIGFDIGEFGTYDFETKSAILMMEYSFTSAGYVCDWPMLTGIYTEPFLNTLKDILSVSPITDKDTLREPFTVSAYSMTSYADYAEAGAFINCDQLVLDALKKNEPAYAAFAEYPFVVDSPEFQEKYAGLVNHELAEAEINALAGLYGRDTLQETSETMLAAISAKNKAFFAAEQSDWLAGLSGNLESSITLSGSENDQTAFTLLLPAALAFCYMNDDYKTRYKTALPVTLSLRNTPKNWAEYSSGYGKNEVLKFSALWHLTRQENHSVPGFCLPEYLVSVDFAPADDTIMTLDIYRYLYAFASQYGFYPDTAHPYRWIYLGKTIPDEALALSPPPKPLEN